MTCSYMFCKTKSFVEGNIILVPTIGYGFYPKIQNEAVIFAGLD